MPAAYELSVFFYPMNRIIFQPDGTRMVPIFHHSIVPLLSHSENGRKTLAFSLLMKCYFLEDSQFLVYKLVRFAYNWNNVMLARSEALALSWNDGFKENCRNSDTLNIGFKYSRSQGKGGVCY